LSYARAPGGLSPSSKHRQRTRREASAPNHCGRPVDRRNYRLGEVPRKEPLRDAGPRSRGGRLRNGSAGCSAAWLARLLWEQEAAGSNPAIPTRSEHMSILIRLRVGAKLGAMC
jgi:hypothetical protein